MQQEMMEVVVVQTGTSRCANTEKNTNRMILLPPTQQSKHGINQLFEYTVGLNGSSVKKN